MIQLGEAFLKYLWGNKFLLLIQSAIDVILPI